MKKQILTLLLAITSLTYAGCKKLIDTYDTSDLYPAGGVKTATSTAVAVFYKNTSFYQIFMYRFDPVTNTWGKNIASNFMTVPPNDSVTIGFSNPYVAGSGVPLFEMNNLYVTELGTSTIKNVKINAPSLIQFFPITAGAKRGIARIITQDIVLTRLNGTTFKIGVSGEGSYDETTKVIDIVVSFDEKDINGPGHKYQYKISVDKLTL